MQILRKSFLVIAAVLLKRRIGSYQFGGVGVNAQMIGCILQSQKAEQSHY
jgi:hypothetical protein